MYEVPINIISQLLASSKPRTEIPKGYLSELCVLVHDGCKVYPSIVSMSRLHIRPLPLPWSLENKF